MEYFDVKPVTEHLSQNTYPGRGILLGLSADGKYAVAVYFIMGRSANSRNRIFAEEADGIRTEAYDPTQMRDPSLIIYHPVRSIGKTLIVTNGDQTDTIRAYLEKGLSMEQALRFRTFEPDAPHWTPRISGLLGEDGSCKISILKSMDKEGSACSRFFFAYPACKGIGHFIHTYACEGDPLPSFIGEPKRVCIPNDIDIFADEIWQALDADNKISLFVRYTDVATRAFEQRIINRHQK